MLDRIRDRLAGRGENLGDLVGADLAAFQEGTHHGARPRSAAGTRGVLVDRDLAVPAFDIGRRKKGRGFNSPFFHAGYIVQKGMKSID